MGIRTILLYLAGNRQAILDLAANRWAVVVGLLFVLSAGFAREYDGEDLLREPWHLVLPLVASLVASSCLFLWTFPWTTKPDGAGGNLVTAYLGFLGLFWLTAPLAWMYAIPYERFLDPLDATRANLATLAVVSLWRVALMARVLVVLWGYKELVAVVLVLAFGDAVATLAMCFSPVPLLDLMSGARLTESERLIRETSLIVLQVGVCSFPILLSVAIGLRTGSTPSRQAAAGHLPEPRPSGPLWSLVAASLLVWVVFLPVTQPEQQRRSSIERAFYEGRVSEAVAEMSARPRSDFPPHWEPPPRYISRWINGNKPLLKTCDVLAEEPAAGWVRDVYLKKLRELLTEAHFDDNNDVERVGRLLRRLPEGRTLVAATEGADADGLRKLKEFVTAEEPAP